MDALKSFVGIPQSPNAMNESACTQEAVVFMIVYVRSFFMLILLYRNSEKFLYEFNICELYRNYIIAKVAKAISTDAQVKID